MQNFLQDVKRNINVLCVICVDFRLQSLAKLNGAFHYQGTTEELSTTQNSQLFTLERSGNAERPRYEIRQEQIHGLREAAMCTVFAYKPKFECIRILSA